MPLKRLYVLVAHEPNRDPRIDWVSRFALDLFDVTVFGMAEPARPELPIERQHGYGIERLERSALGFRSFALAFCRVFLLSSLLWWPLLLALLVPPLLIWRVCR